MMGDDNKIRQFVKGDLVSFEGYRYSPDYMYEDAEEGYKCGVVVSIGRGYMEGILYRVYWFKEKCTTETIAAHLKLLYIRDNFKD
tara:strand:+ start:1271 stop:1525 length:255 start_codon:yes stop_codon:yes gene_type:complete